MKPALICLTVLMTALIAAGTVLICLGHEVVGTVVIAICLMLVFMLLAMIASDIKADVAVKTAAVRPQSEVMKHGG